jgi:hypothetical protein
MRMAHPTQMECWCRVSHLTPTVGNRVRRHDRTAHFSPLEAEGRGSEGAIQVNLEGKTRY